MKQYDTYDNVKNEQQDFNTIEDVKIKEEHLNKLNQAFETLKTETADLMQKIKEFESKKLKQLLKLKQ